MLRVDERTLPADFKARLRAARAYADDLSREDFAARLNTPGASASTLKDWEAGLRAPAPLVFEALVQRLANASGLPETFFYGDAANQTADQLTAIDETLRQLALDIQTRDLEAQQRLSDIEQAIQKIQPQAQRPA